MSDWRLILRICWQRWKGGAFSGNDFSLLALIYFTFDMDTAIKVLLSVLIPTKDEERNIAACIDSVSFAGEIIVFDSLSTDYTLEIAGAKGARIMQRKFDVFSTHKNWALDNIGFDNEWILILDADERVSPELREEIISLINAPPLLNGYYVARKNMFSGKWIRHCGMYPDWQLRLLRRGKARYEDRIVHEHMILEGKAGFLNEPLFHHDYKGMNRYFDRHNHYSDLEAIEIYRELAGSTSPPTSGDVFIKGPHRRRALKNFAYHWLPMRPFFVFCYMYFLRFGFLDGRIGFRYCLLRAIYEYQISLKLLELRDPDSPISAQYGKYLNR
ncbi:MAG: glycosyltransferase family 2 protein [Mariprofundaceae bacterium]